MSKIIHIPKILTYEVLREIYSLGISGGDKDNMFQITNIGGDKLTTPILIPHELHHIMSGIERMEWAAKMILDKVK